MNLMSQVRRFGPLLLTAAAGFGLARWSEPPRLEEEILRRLERQEARLEALARRLESAPAPPARAAPRSHPELDLAAVREDLRQLLREELHTALASTAPQTPGEKRPPAVPEDPAVYAKARQWLDDSIAARRWGDRQRSELIVLRRQLTDAQFAELLQKLVVAINNQQLRIETDGPPF
ncbi:hypothetical protein HPP05_38510 [Corallococcus exiguus]|uniref:hypothetical protein n=2 Tax=Corallococcus exiguus TaxID=83462 RepID=UPI0014944CB0|nr:hypothetical protein [Corallococcus exiguus]NPC75649.1 hypothetical protein [Corallococcus exiguus]NPD22066.1 hypothetical protein [Corallococcus exiguus]